MKSLRAASRRLLALVGRRRRDEELADEIDAHLLLHIEDNLRAGMTPAQARRDALLKFGGVELAKERSRDVRGIRLLDELIQDLRYAVRVLRKSPAFTAAAVLTIALGVGVNTAVFSVVNAIVLRPLPVRDADRLVVIASRRASNVSLRGVSFLDFLDYRAAAPDVFEGLAAYSVGFAGLAPEGGRPERVLVTWISGEYFSTLGIRPAIGHLMRLQDDTVAPEPIAVLGYSTWRRRFGGDPSIVGRKVLINGRPHTIVGVAPAEFAGTFAFSESEFYLPMNWIASGASDQRSSRGLHAIARLRPGVSIERAQAVMSLVAARLERQYPDTNKGIAISVVPERLARPEEDGARTNALGSSIMLVLVGLVLLVAAVNVTNLLLARATNRRKELAMRAALGAGRGRLIRQLLTENALLVVAGGVAGVVLADWTASLLATIRLPGDLPVRLDFHLDRRVLVYAGAVACLTGAIVGLLPAMRAARPDVEPALRHGSPGSQATGGHRARSALVVAQIGICFVLLVAAGLFTRSLSRAEHADLGFRPEGILNVQMNVAELAYTAARGRAFYDEIERRVREIPGVVDTSFAATIPMGYVSMTLRIDAEGQTMTAGQRPLAGVNLVGAHYFSTMGVPIVRGRSFTDADDSRAKQVAIVNQRFADLVWPGENPIGRRFNHDGRAGSWAEVVGVTTTGTYRFLFEEPQPFFYLPIAQHYSALRALHVRATLAPEALAPSIERVIHEREPALALFDVQPMPRALGGGYGFFLVRTAAVFAAVFGFLATALAVVGLYGVMSYMASQRTHEIGVRVALGATRRDILRLILGHGVVLLVLGLGGGLLSALALSRFLATFLFGISPRDPIALVGVAPLLGGAAIVACLIPAWRATHVDPTVALRAQ